MLSLVATQGTPRAFSRFASKSFLLAGTVDHPGLPGRRVLHKGDEHWVWKVAWPGAKLHGWFKFKNYLPLSIIQVVDTPGFGDTDNEDEALIDEMMDTLANILDHADTLLLVLPGSTERFSESLQEMLMRMTLMFGQNWWDFVVIGVSFWAYDQDSIDDRVCSPDYPDFCKDEEHFAANINSMMQKYFGLDQNFTFVFTDSWSQTAGPPGFNTDDPLQQESESENKQTIMISNRITGKRRRASSGSSRWAERRASTS